MRYTLTILFIASAIAGCSKDFSFDTLETNRTNAKANAEYNAQKFRAESPHYSNTALEVQGDSTQSPSCPQGDGCASAKLVDKEQAKKESQEAEQAWLHMVLYPAVWFLAGFWASGGFSGLHRKKPNV